MPCRKDSNRDTTAAIVQVIHLWLINTQCPLWMKTTGTQETLKLCVTHGQLAPCLPWVASLYLTLAAPNLLAPQGAKCNWFALSMTPLSMAESHIMMLWARLGGCAAPRALTASCWNRHPTCIWALPHHSHVCCPTCSPSFPGPVCWHMATPCCLTSGSTYGFPQKTRPVPVTNTCKRDLFPTTRWQKDQSRAIIPSGSPKSTFSEYIGFLREATQCS